MQDQVVAWSGLIMKMAAREDQANLMQDPETRLKHQEKARGYYRDILTEALTETDGSLLHLLALSLQWLYHKGAVTAFIRFQHWFDVYTLEYRINKLCCASSQSKSAQMSQCLMHFHRHVMLCLHCNPVVSSRQPVVSLHTSASRLDLTTTLSCMSHPVAVCCDIDNLATCKLIQSDCCPSFGKSCCRLLSIGM